MDEAMRLSDEIKQQDQAMISSNDIKLKEQVTRSQGMRSNDGIKV